MIDYKNIKEFLPQDFHDESRVWIYQSNRILSMSEAFTIEPLLNSFIEQWKSHGSPVKGFANLIFGQFIIIMADESKTQVGGCSTDSSVRLIKQIEQELQIELFNRQNLAFIIKDKIQILPMQQINYALENEFINSDTLYFNNLVATKKELIEKWIIPVKESWLASRLVVNS
ncbi:MAG: hypothetical protein KGZ59_05360 [Chitinophagaceae bacterium]|nr:hypothetical protein [Chitinophagaceae bacterium]MBS4043225.1 hypothetical protein [Chitinophagaceae bacterium]